MSRTPATFKQTDLVRAVKGARAAGLTVSRTEIRPDGSIVLVHESDGQEAESVDELETWRRSNERARAA